MSEFALFLVQFGAALSLVGLATYHASVAVSAIVGRSHSGALLCLASFVGEVLAIAWVISIL